MAVGNLIIPDKGKTLAQKVREATDPVTLPYGVFGVLGNPYIGRVYDEHGNSAPRKPHRKQGLFLCNKYNQVFEGFYGGAAGGAKSDAMLMAALQFVMVPNYRAIILRKNYAQLSKAGALMERAHTWLSQTDAVWNDNKKTWTFPSGAKLEFGHLENGMNSALNYGGSNYHFIGIDEVTDIEEKVYVFLMSRCRRDTGDEYIPLRVRSASNPIGPGLPWVKRRYVLPVRDRKKASIFRIKNDDGEYDTRFFIPASLKDNPYLDRKEYEKALKRLDDTTRKRLLDGDWDAKNAGAVFDTSYFEMVTQKEVPARLELIRYWDLAGTDADENPDSSNTVGLLYGFDRVTGFDYVLDVVKFQQNPTDVEQRLMSVAHADGREVSIRIEQEPGSSGKAWVWAFQEALRGYDVEGDLPNKRGAKEVRAKPVANKLGRRRIRCLEGSWNEEFFADLEAFPGSGGDTVDALSGAHSSSRATKKVKSTNRMRTKSRRNIKIVHRGEAV